MMTINPGIADPPMFCLNLARRPDRRLRAWSQFRAAGLKVHRIEAPDAVRAGEAREWRNAGIRACALAHRMAWRQARIMNREAVLVFEDDVQLCPDFRERLGSLILPEDWMICYFGCVFHTPPVNLGRGVLGITGKTWDAHAYLIRKPFWEALHPEFIKASRKPPGLSPVAGEEAPPPAGTLANDTIMAELHDRFPAYSVWPPMAWQVENLSNNEHQVRGNYLPDGTQNLLRHAIAHLPRAPAPPADKESGRACPPPGTDVKASEDPMSGRWLPLPAKGVEPAYARSVRKHSRVPAPGQGFLISPYSAESERMAYALVSSLRRYNPEVPVCVLGQDYVCGLDWRGLAQVRSVRAAEAHGTDFQWFNKLSALLRSPFEETVYLDCDIVFVTDPGGWLEQLGTDDFTWFRRPWSVEDVPDKMMYNFVNPHRMREEFGVDSVPVIDGSGHFFLRKSGRGHRLVQRVVDLMVEAVENPATSLYRRMTGAGNVAASDEAAASIVAVQEQIRFPPVVEPPCKPLGIYLPPHHGEGIFDFERGVARYRNLEKHDEAGTLITPQAMHFCWLSKSHPAYQQYIRQCLERPRRKQPLTAV